jgi:small subunit ribosomal protein S6
LLEVTNLDTAVKKLYEGMFLIDSAEAAKDWDGIMELVGKMLTKADAEIVSIRKWDERPLAYKIRGCDRGTYILAYFRADGKKNHEIEREVQLSERIMRVLILKADHLTEEDIAKATPATRCEKQGQPAATCRQQEVSSETAEAASELPLRGEAEPAEAALGEVSPPAEATDDFAAGENEGTLAQ